MYQWKCWFNASASGFCIIRHNMPKSLVITVIVAVRNSQFYFSDLKVLVSDPQKYASVILFIPIRNSLYLKKTSPNWEIQGSFYCTEWKDIFTGTSVLFLSHWNGTRREVQLLFADMLLHCLPVKWLYVTRCYQRFSLVAKWNTGY